MAHYIFAPSPNFGISEHAFTTWRNAFTDEELTRIVDYCDALPKQPAIVNVDTQDPEVRTSDVAWVGQNQDTEWIYDKLSYIIRNLNGQFYNFDMYGFTEDMQYTVYNSSESGHYTWHQDYGAGVSGSLPPRKLSLVLQLSDPSEYEGGELEILSSAQPVAVDKVKGLIAVFPSFMLHRVSPVTSGIRKTIVIWATGPSFK
jgi:PKHD-type hydroxylase